MLLARWGGNNGKPSNPSRDLVNKWTKSIPCLQYGKSSRIPHPGELNGSNSLPGLCSTRHIGISFLVYWRARYSDGRRVPDLYFGQNVFTTVSVDLHPHSWIKTDQPDVTRFIISLFTAQHVSNVSTSIFMSLRLTVDLFHVLYFSGSMCVGVTVWFGWGGVVSLCRLKH